MRDLLETDLAHVGGICSCCLIEFTVGVLRTFMFGCWKPQGRWEENDGLSSSRSGLRHKWVLKKIIESHVGSASNVSSWIKSWLHLTPWMMNTNDHKSQRPLLAKWKTTCEMSPSTWCMQLRNYTWNMLHCDWSQMSFGTRLCSVLMDHLSWFAIESTPFRWFVMCDQANLWMLMIKRDGTFCNPDSLAADWWIDGRSTDKTVNIDRAK